MELKKKLGKRIQELRCKNGLKQAELAEKVGIATKTQSCIETGKNFPSADLIERYANALNVDISEILNISHIKTREELLKETKELIEKADDNQLIIANRILNDILN